MSDAAGAIVNAIRKITDVAMKHDAIFAAHIKRLEECVRELETRIAALEKRRETRDE